jgi:hypothetical protein
MAGSLGKHLTVFLLLTLQIFELQGIKTNALFSAVFRSKLVGQSLFGETGFTL